jgi:hypothetical protein
MINRTKILERMSDIKQEKKHLIDYIEMTEQKTRYSSAEVTSNLIQVKSRIRLLCETSERLLEELLSINFQEHNDSQNKVHNCKI